MTRKIYQPIPKIIDRVSKYIADATGYIHGARALAEGLQAKGYLTLDNELPGPWETISEANKYGVLSGTLMNGDTFGNEDDDGRPKRR